MAGSKPLATGLLLKDYVVVEARGNNTTKTGKPYNNAYCFVIRLHGGQLKEITEYMDTELVTAVLEDTAA